MATRANMKLGIATWLSAITASSIGAGDGLQVLFRGEKQGWRKKAHALVYLRPVQNVTRDTVVYEYDSGGDEILVTQVGMRTIVAEIQIFSSRASGSYDAGEYAQRIRNRILLEDFDSGLTTADCAFNSFLLDQDISDVAEDREHTVHQMDILFNTTSEESGTPIGYIETIEYITEFTDPAGDPTVVISDVIDLS